MGKKISKNKERESGIEFLKTLAMLIICISHVTQTLYTRFNWIDNSYVITLENTTHNISHFILSCFSGFGALGNIIFFICSSWFLIDSKKVNKKKIAHIIFNVFFINLIFLMIFKFGNWYDIPIKTFIKCLLPTTFELNWYITYYLLFYSIHTLLNKIIFSLSKKQLLSIVIIMLFLYFGINFVHAQHFGINALILFITIYFTIAYIKLYLKEYSKNTKANVITLIIGIFGMVTLMFLTNFLGNHISYFSDKLLYWNKSANPFFLLIGISLFNLFKNKLFFNKKINYISSLTLLIYIIHENYLIRSYLRPLIWKWIYENLGYNYIVIKDLWFAILLFACAIILAIIYKNTLQKSIYKICDILYKYASILYNKIIDFLLKI